MSQTTQTLTLPADVTGLIEHWRHSGRGASAALAGQVWRELRDHTRQQSMQAGADGSRPGGSWQAGLWQAFDELSRIDEIKARAFALNELAGFPLADTAALLGVSETALQRDLRFARAWLASRLSC
ncbi:MAG: ECF-type sigma factor [Pseudoxanthomonas sp.]